MAGVLSGRERSLSRALVLLIERTFELGRVAEETLGREGVANRDIGILMAVRLQPGLSPSALAHQLGVSRGVVSHALGRFQKAGLITRVADPLDHRVFRLALSRRGRRAVGTFQSRLAEWMIEARPQTEEISSLLGGDRGSDENREAPTSLEAAQALSGAGEGYRVDVVQALHPYGIEHDLDRFAVTFIHDQGPSRPTTLAKFLGLTTGGTTAMLERLTHAGLVERANRPDLGDRRAVLVSLTPRGTDAARVALAVLERHALSLSDAVSRSQCVASTAGAA